VELNSHGPILRAFRDTLHVTIARAIAAVLHQLLAHLRKPRDHDSRMETITPTDDALRSRAAAIARALADPKRACVVEELAAGDRSVSDLSRCIGCQVPN